MIQSDKFDSSDMDIKKIANSSLIFITNRLIEILGLIVSIFSLLLFLALISYSPSDPNFIFSENTEIKNFLGYQGSYISDFFLQSFGIISFLIPISYFFSGINIFKKKEIFFLIENTFYIILYSIVGSVFFSHFYNNGFTLYINGNGGFIGSYFDSVFVLSKITDYNNIIYYLFIFLISVFFFLSVNFKPKKFFINMKYLSSWINL